ncbi:MAG TPA: ABC transporter substrate-binding protein, partial [Anaerolineaceae bacterium]|nr:ABC transporter substrate-binding protein [Anaerolineaceae bacterium]
MSGKCFRFFSSLLTICLVAASFNASPKAVIASDLQAGTQYEFVAAQQLLINTLDPALAYDTGSEQIIQQVYEPLITYNREKTDDFIPQLASSWDISADGSTYTFHIRPGVTFHGGQTLTPEDVAYTFQRGILHGGGASPQWTLTEPFLGIGIQDITGIVDGYASWDDRSSLKMNDPAVLLAACEAVKSKIVANDAAGTVTMHLVQSWSPFLATLASTWGSIIDKGWVISEGGWDGNCATWQNYYAMSSAEDPLSLVANGTGPFILDHYTVDNEVVLVRNSNYWRTTPMWPDGPNGLTKLARVTIKHVG